MKVVYARQKAHMHPTIYLRNIEKFEKTTKNSGLPPQKIAILEP